MNIGMQITLKTVFLLLIDVISIGFSFLPFFLALFCASHEKMTNAIPVNKVILYCIVILLLLVSGLSWIMYRLIAIFNRKYNFATNPRARVIFLLIWQATAMVVLFGLIPAIGSIINLSSW